MDSVKDILHRNNLKGTSARIAILNTIISSEAPLSESDIKKRIHEVDRVTFYRSIKSLLDTKIIQGMITQGKIIKYTFCPENQNNETAVQFYCTECQRIADVEIKTQFPVVPQGYKEKTRSITITGICKACNNSSEEEIDGVVI
ncbi:MAG: Fur family transcriptional regulator [Dysgonomonas sp.]|jgi:Fur family ferric uptake transcriptional regulator|uniref:Fur family transcriptional regulator n=1 Tax=Dysgonomonas sp. TaxID=1891233 RepID=UPI002836E848|nr:transcriptional repressor [Prevotella sp.]